VTVPFSLSRIVFLHYWGVGPTQQLARGPKAALDTQGHGGAQPKPRDASRAP